MPKAVASDNGYAIFLAPFPVAVEPPVYQLVGPGDKVYGVTTDLDELIGFMHSLARDDEEVEFDAGTAAYGDFVLRIVVVRNGNGKWQRRFVELILNHQVIGRYEDEFAAKRAVDGMPKPATRVSHGPTFGPGNP